MADRTLTALFVVQAEAERAATQLRAAGVEDTDIAIASPAPEAGDRADEVGVPDSSSGVAGLRGDEDRPAAPIRLTVRIDRARVDEDQLVHVLNAAGGRLA